MYNTKKSGLIILMAVILLLPIIAIGSYTDLFGSILAITGMDSSNATTVTITVGNDYPNITFVSLNSTITVTEGGRKLLYVTFLANDTDANHDNASAKVNVSLGTTHHIVNDTCTAASIPNSGSVVNYTCTIPIEYWYDAGDWMVTAEINDSSNNKYINTTYWGLQELKSMNVTSIALAFPTIIPGGTNATSNNDPITIENTGNADTLDIYVQAIDLWEDAAGATYIGAANFTVFNITSGDAAPNLECDWKNHSAAVIYGSQPVILQNDTDMPVILNALDRGQGSNDTLYFCLFEAPPNLISATYSTGGAAMDEEDWTISVQ